MSVNQKQIAKKAGVSISLVSRVISGRAEEIGIAASTIERVMKTAKEMGYRPNIAAQSLKGKSTQTIGVVVYDFKDPFFGIVVHHLQLLAHEKSYTLLLIGFQNREPDTRDLQQLSKYNLDGIIAVGSDYSENWLAEFSHLPCARIGSGNPATNSLKITSDDPLGYALLAEQIKQKNVRSVAFLGAAMPIHQQRAEFFEQSVPALSPIIQISEDASLSSFATGMTLCQKFTETEWPELLVCANDRIAMGAIHAASKAGLSVPADVQVVGYDDIPAAAQFLPALSSIRQPIAAIAKQAFESILEKNCPNETRLIAPELIIRNSFR